MIDCVYYFHIINLIPSDLWPWLHVLDPLSAHFELTLKQSIGLYAMSHSRF